MVESQRRNICHKFPSVYNLIIKISQEYKSIRVLKNLIKMVKITEKAIYKETETVIKYMTWCSTPPRRTMMQTKTNRSLFAITPAGRLVMAMTANVWGSMFSWPSGGEQVGLPFWKAKQQIQSNVKVKPFEPALSTWGSTREQAGSLQTHLTGWASQRLRGVCHWTATSFLTESLPSARSWQRA